MQLAIESRTSHTRKAAKVAGKNADYKRQSRQSGHAFSAGNPNGKRAAGDKRQFARI